MDAAPLLLGYAHTGGSSSQQAPAAAVLSELQQLLQRLQQSGYICGYQLVWGSLPGDWPGDWAVSEPQFVDADDVLQQPEPIAGGSVFQVGLLLPAVPFAVSSKCGSSGSSGGGFHMSAGGCCCVLCCVKCSCVGSSGGGFCTHTGIVEAPVQAFGTSRMGTHADCMQ